MNRLTIFDPSFDRYKVRIDGHTMYTPPGALHEPWLLGNVVDKLAEYENTQQWVSVKDRLPKKETLVLCLEKSGRVFVGHQLRLFKDTAFCLSPYTVHSHEVTHWANIPELPEEVLKK